MSCCIQVPNEENIINNQIANAQLRDQKTDISIQKLLLLGSGQSGKSTVFKNVINIYKKGYTLDDRKNYISIVQNNAMAGILTIIQQINKFNVIIDSSTEDIIEKIELCKSDTNITPEIGQMIDQIWHDEGIQEIYENRSRFQLDDSAKYFLDNIIRISEYNYIPTDEDIIRSRVRTTGIVEISFEVEGKTFKMYDVGGQRNERKKWIHCFENVTAVIFVVAVSEYDQVLYEDENTNRMIESLNLFEEIVNSRWFLKTSFILFLNKKDLFEEKIKKVNLNVCFPEYNGPSDYEHCMKFVRNKFLERNKDQQNREIYTHPTCATDKDNIKVVFNSVKDIIIAQSLREGGLM